MSTQALASSWRAYRAVMSARLREALQYRTAAIAGMVTQVFWGLIRLMIFRAFYASTAAAQPMTLAETTDYLWLVQALLLLMPWRHDDEIQNMIRTGNVAYELVKPTDLYLLWFARILGGRAALLLLRLPLIYSVAALFFGLRLPASPAAAGAFALSVLAAFLLSSAISTLMTISLMWTVTGDGLSRLTSTLATVLSGSVIPLPLFPDSFQTVLNVLPFRGLMDIPFRLYSGNIPLVDRPRELAFQLAWALGLMLLGRFALQRGLRRLVLQGG
ncbi:MAG: ABC-2 type transporter [Anaerolineales bacterium]